MPFLEEGFGGHLGDYPRPRECNCLKKGMGNGEVNRETRGLNPQISSIDDANNFFPLHASGHFYELSQISNRNDLLYSISSFHSILSFLSEIFTIF